MSAVRATAWVCLGFAVSTGNALAQECDPTIAPTLAVEGSFDAGQTVTFRASGVSPGEMVHFVRSQDGGANACPPFMGGDCLDIGGNLLMASTGAGPNGEAHLQVTLHEAVEEGLEAALQAASTSCGTPVQSDVLELVVGSAKTGSDLSDDSISGATCSFGQGAWGQTCRGKNVGCTRDAGFDLAFPNGLAVAGPSPVFFSSSEEVRDFLPAGGPAYRGPDSAFYGQLVALALNLGFNDAGLFGAGSDLRSETVAEGLYAGQTAGQLYDFAESIGLGDVTDELTDALESLNEAFEGCDLQGGIVQPISDPPVASDDCGDGIIQPGEVCDGEPGCSDTCTSSLVDIELGQLHGCGLDDVGEIVCWGESDGGRTAVPKSGPWLAVSAGGYHSCAVDSSEALECWGEDLYGQISGMPNTSFLEVSSGHHHTCGLSVLGEIHCWGKDDFGQVSGAPSGVFDGVSAGNQHSCAWVNGGDAICWGRNNYGQSAAPEGAFTQVVSGSNFSCGLNVKGGAVCWGSDLVGRSTPPLDTFTSIGLGANFGCGHRTDGTLACWGSTYNDRSAAPAGVWSGLAVGDYSSCAWSSDEVSCWGDLDGGPLSPW